MKLGKVTLVAVIIAASFIVFGTWIVFKEREVSGDVIHYILPNNYRGVFKLIEDQKAAIEVECQGHKYIVRIPASGILKFQSFRSFHDWHAVTAAYDSGEPILIDPDDDINSNTVALFMMRSGNQSHWFFLGKQTDAHTLSKMRTDELDSQLPQTGAIMRYEAPTSR